MTEVMASIVNVGNSPKKKQITNKDPLKQVKSYQKGFGKTFCCTLPCQNSS